MGDSSDSDFGDSGRRPPVLHRYHRHDPHQIDHQRDSRADRRPDHHRSSRTRDHGPNRSYHRPYHQPHQSEHQLDWTTDHQPNYQPNTHQLESHTPDHQFHHCPGKQVARASQSDQHGVQSATSRLTLALNRARRAISSSDAKKRSLTEELGGRFSFASSEPRKIRPKRRKTLPWKVVPCVLPPPDTNKVPVKGPMDALCKVGLGTLWFSREDQLELATHLTPEELHFVILCLYPKLKEIPYEFCKATGPGNSVVVPLSIDDPRMKPRINRTFRPFFAPDRLKEPVGRKGKLYIRPVVPIDLTRCKRLPEHEVILL